MLTQMIHASALLLFLVFALAPAVKSWFTALHDEPSIKAAVATVGNPYSCGLWAPYISTLEHERAFVVHVIRNDRRDDGRGSEIQPV